MINIQKKFRDNMALILYKDGKKIKTIRFYSAINGKKSFKDLETGEYEIVAVTSTVIPFYRSKTFKVNYDGRNHINLLVKRSRGNIFAKYTTEHGNFFEFEQN